MRWQQRLEQGYLLTGGAATAAIGTSLAGTTNTGAADLTLRVRRSAEQAWLTLKARAPQTLAPERPAALSRLDERLQGTDPEQGQRLRSAIQALGPLQSDEQLAQQF